MTGAIGVTAQTATPATATTTKDTRQEVYVPTKENLAAREEFQDNKFGIFLHWGIYSMMAQGEWYMHRCNIPAGEYSKMAAAFYPSYFNAAQWVSAIKASGAKYICITSRHHDSFSMFDTKASNYDIVDATPFKRDVLKELADECHKQGIKLHFYYSHLDWNRDDYKNDWPHYYRFMETQLRELLTNYGEIGAIWFDGVWSKPESFDWGLRRQYDMIHRLQPSCLIANNHHRTPYPGEDIQVFERDLPGENNAGLSGQDISRLPLETCETMNGMWGYKIEDQNYKSTKELIHYLVKAAGKNANLLMNIGPQPDGRLPQTALNRLKEMGEWMATYGSTIYGTRGGDVKPHDWGVSTRKGDKLFIHILSLNDNSLFIPLKGIKVKQAKVFATNKALQYKQDADGVLLKLGQTPTDIDHVVELTVR